jgi:hypothetical protein
MPPAAGRDCGRPPARPARAGADACGRLLRNRACHRAGNDRDPHARGGGEHRVWRPRRLLERLRRRERRDPGTGAPRDAGRDDLPAGAGSRRHAKRPGRHPSRRQQRRVVAGRLDLFERRGSVALRRRVRERRQDRRRPGAARDAHRQAQSRQRADSGRRRVVRLRSASKRAVFREYCGRPACRRAL